MSEIKMGLPWWLSGKESACQYRGTHVQSLVREDPTCSQAAKPMCLQAIEPISVTKDATAMRRSRTATKSKLSKKNQDSPTPIPSPVLGLPSGLDFGGLVSGWHRAKESV